MNGLEPIGVISVNEGGVRCCVVVWQMSCRFTEGRRGWGSLWGGGVRGGLNFAGCYGHFVGEVWLLGDEDDELVVSGLPAARPGFEEVCCTVVHEDAGWEERRCVSQDLDLARRVDRGIRGKERS